MPGKSRTPRTVPLPSQHDVAALVKRMRGEVDSSANYRTRALQLHGPICAKCGREFTPSNLHLLTVHHRDGNHSNNPPDGSNWENLCIDCHDDEHRRGILGEFLSRNESS